MLPILLATAVTPPAPSPVTTRACLPPHDRWAFCNTSLSLAERVDDLVSRLAPSEIPALLTAREGGGGSPGPPGNVSRLGLPEYDWGVNCVHGACCCFSAFTIRMSRCDTASRPLLLPPPSCATLALPGVQTTCGRVGEEPRCPTSFPSPNSLGATFNTSLWRDIGSAIGLELRSLWLQGAREAMPWSGQPHAGLDCWSPNINIARDPRWGRNQEVPSEDPTVNGLFGQMYTIGLQTGQDPRYLQAVVTLKHFDAYSLEKADGFTRHDFNAQVSNFSLASTYLPAFRAAVTRGGATGVMCSYNAINGIPACASGMLNQTLRGEWGFTGYITSDTGAVEDIYKHHAYVPDGPRAACAALAAGGTDIDSGKVYSESLLEGVRLGYCSMDDLRRSLRRTLGLRFRLGLFDPIEAQPYWHVPPEAVASPTHRQLNLLAARSSIVLLKNEPLLGVPAGSGSERVHEERIDAPGVADPSRRADEQAGPVPSEWVWGGKLTGRLGVIAPQTLPLPTGRSLAVIGPHANASAALVGNYVGQVCPGASPTDLSCVETVAGALSAFASSTAVVEGSGLTRPILGGVAAAVAAARAAEHVVLMLGIGQSIEGEGRDRTSIGLPKAQAELAAAVLALGKPAVLVLINGGVVSAAEVFGAAPAIVEAFYPGVLGARAIAETLYGANPHCCGKLPFTLYPESYVSAVKMSDMEVRPSPASGSPGRTYKWYTGPALFRFGDGLALTSFDVRAADGFVSTPIVLPIAKVRRHVAQPQGQPPLLRLAVTISNTGTREGDEVPMLFVDPPASVAALGFSPPRTQLAAFERVHLLPGKSTVVRFDVDVAEALALVNDAGDAALVPGRFVLRCAIGGGKAVTQEVELKGDAWAVRPFLS